MSFSTGSCSYYPPWKYLLFCVTITCLENICHCPFSSLMSFQAVTSMCAITCFNIHKSWLFLNSGYETQIILSTAAVRTYWQSHSNLQRRHKKVTAMSGKSRCQMNSRTVRKVNIWIWIAKKTKRWQLSKDLEESCLHPVTNEHDVWKYHVENFNKISNSYIPKTAVPTVTNLLPTVRKEINFWWRAPIHNNNTHFQRS
jgi:hypothetical protein